MRFPCLPIYLLLLVLLGQALVPTAIASGSGSSVPAESAVPVSPVSSGQEDGEEPADLAAARELVRALDSDRFAEREQAAQELLKLGDVAITALNESLNAGTLQARREATELLGRIEARAFARRLSLLREAPEATAAAALPDWTRYCEVMEIDSQSPTKQELLNFASILESEPDLFRLKLYRPRALPNALAARSSELAAAFHDRRDESFPVESYAALLLLGSDPRTRLARATSTNITAGLADARFEELVRDGSQRTALRALLSAWFVRPEISAERPLRFTIEHRVQGGLERARSIVDARSSRPEMILALLVLGSAGSRDEDLSRLEELLDQADILWPFGAARATVPRPDGQPVDSQYTVRTCDMALAVACHLRGVNPRKFGMKSVRTRATLFAVDSLGFASDASRQAAVAAYRDAFALD